MFQMIVDALQQAWQTFVESMILFLPRLIVMLAIFFAGLLIAWLVSRVTSRLLGWLRFDKLIERADGGELLRKAGLPPAHMAAGSVVYWLVLTGFLLSSLQSLGLAGMEMVVAEFLRFVPRIGVALVILVAGGGIATFCWRATLIAGVNASVRWARALSEVVRFLILLLAVAMALEQLAPAHSVVLIAFAITFGAVMTGVAVAIGIGGSGIVRRALEEKWDEGRPPGSDAAPHL